MLALALPAPATARGDERGDVVFHLTVSPTQYTAIRGPDLDSRRRYRVRVVGTASIASVQRSYDALYCFQGCPSATYEPMILFSGWGLDEFAGLQPGRIPYDAFHEYVVELEPRGYGREGVLRIVVRDIYGLSGNTGGWTVTITDVGPATGAPSPTAAPKAVRLVDSPEYRTFLGLDDRPTPGWETRVRVRSAELRRRAAAFPGATAAAEIPGEGRFGKHSPNLLYPGNDLFTLLALDFPSGVLAARGNVYAGATRESQKQLEQAILASGGGLQPADVLELALRATNGSYPLAVLAAHNLLKDATKLGRAAIQDAARLKPGRSAPAIETYNRRQAAELAELRRWTPLVAKLTSLRKNPAARPDKVGPWYHAFAVLTAGALAGPKTAQLVVWAEHGAKRSKDVVKQLQRALPKSVIGDGFFKGESGFDPEKHRLDQSIAEVARSPQLARLSR